LTGKTWLADDNPTGQNDRPPPPSAHLQLFWQKKKHQVSFSRCHKENIARVNFLRKPSNSSILMAINAINAIFLDQVNP
jgi:hypothetical protein